jgi:tetratricopeptide (TPR) repeat protein
MKNLGLASVFLFTIAIVIHYDLNRSFHTESTSMSQLLYLPSGKYLKPASFGYDSLVSDFVYLWSIQYFGEFRLPRKYEYLKHTYDIITELDPLYLDPYYTGALFMFYEGRNPQGGLALLDEGLKNNPTEWILPTDAGFYCMFNLKDKSLAAKYFEKASRVPGAPSMPKRILASLRFKMGDKQTAYLLWKQVYDTETRPSIKQTAYQHMFELRVLLDLEYLRTAIQQFYQKFQKYPRNLNQLVMEKVISEIPNDPDGNPYQYNPQTGTVHYTKLRLYKKYEE